MMWIASQKKCKAAWCNISGAMCTWDLEVACRGMCLEDVQQQSRHDFGLNKDRCLGAQASHAAAFWRRPCTT